MQILKSILLWFFLPINFFFFTKKRGLLNKWVALLLSIISPVSLIFLLILFVAIILCHSECQRKYHYTRRSVLKEIVGVKLPKYKVVKREFGDVSFNSKELFLNLLNCIICCYWLNVNRQHHTA